MKITMEQITEGEDEVIIRYQQMNDEVETIVSIVQSYGKRIEGYEDRGILRQILKGGRDDE